MTEKNESAKRTDRCSYYGRFCGQKYLWMGEKDIKCEKVVVKHFSRSTTEGLMTYMKPPLKRNPDRFIIHVGTKDLRSDQDHTVEVANNIKTDTNKVLISSIVPQCDNLNGKGRQVNFFLKKFCIENDFVYVNHDNIKPGHHCNYGGTYLNTLGSDILADNYILALNKLN